MWLGQAGVICMPSTRTPTLSPSSPRKAAMPVCPPLRTTLAPGISFRNEAVSCPGRSMPGADMSTLLTPSGAGKDAAVTVTVSSVGVAWEYTGLQANAAAAVKIFILMGSSESEVKQARPLKGGWPKNAVEALKINPRPALAGPCRASAQPVKKGFSGRPHLEQNGDRGAARKRAKPHASAEAGQFKVQEAHG